MNDIMITKKENCLRIVWFCILFSSLETVNLNPEKRSDIPLNEKPKSTFLMEAALVGEKGKVEVDLFRNITDVLMKDAKMKKYFPSCTIGYVPLEFDLSNAINIQKDLTFARETCDNNRVAVAIGPFIDHFTSPNYVITKQCHFLTTSIASVRKSADKSRIRSLLPDPEDFSNVVAEVMNKLNWKKVVFLSDDDFSPLLKLRENDIMVNPILLPSMHHLSGSTDTLHETLRSLRSSEWPNFVLHSNNLNIVKRVLKEAKDMHLLYGELNWFVTYLNFQALEVTISDKSLTNIYGLELINKAKIPEEIIQSHTEKTILDLAVVVDLVSILLHINIEHNQRCNSKPLKPELFKIMNTPYDGALGYYQLKDYRRNNYTIFIKTPQSDVGEITVRDTEVVVNVSMPPKKDGISPFGKNETLRIVTEEAPPFIECDKRTNECQGFCMDVLKYISTALNFKYNITPLFQKSSIEYQLLSGNASMAIGAIMMSSRNEMLISSSYGIITSQTSILIKRPKSDDQFFQFLLPFSPNLWYTIVMSMLVVALALFLMSRYDQTQDKSEFDLKESLWYSINVLLNNGTEYSPQTTSTRTVIAFYWFCILIINAAYTANLTAFLTLQQKDRSLRTIRQLVDQSEYQYGVLNSSELKGFFRDSRKDPYERMWLQMSTKGNELIIDNVKDAVKKVRKESYAFIHDEIVNEYYAGKHCNLETHRQPIGEKSYAFAFPKGAPYRDEINRALLQLKENGTLDYLKKKWLHGKCGAHSEMVTLKAQANSKLRFSDMRGLFLVMGFFAAVAMLFEMFRQNYICIEKQCKLRNKDVDKEVREKEPEFVIEKFL